VLCFQPDWSSAHAGSIDHRLFKTWLGIGEAWPTAQPLLTCRSAQRRTESSRIERGPRSIPRHQAGTCAGVETLSYYHISYNTRSAVLVPLDLQLRQVAFAGPPRSPPGWRRRRRQQHAAGFPGRSAGCCIRAG
jgi:hypothetical protein